MRLVVEKLSEKLEAIYINGIQHFDHAGLSRLEDELRNKLPGVKIDAIAQPFPSYTEIHIKLNDYCAYFDVGGYVEHNVITGRLMTKTLKNKPMATDLELDHCKAFTFKGIKVISGDISRYNGVNEFKDYLKWVDESIELDTDNSSIKLSNLLVRSNDCNGVPVLVRRSTYIGVVDGLMQVFDRRFLTMCRAVEVINPLGPPQGFEERVASNEYVSIEKQWISFHTESFNLEMYEQHGFFFIEADPHCNNPDNVILFKDRSYKKAIAYYTGFINLYNTSLPQSREEKF